MTHAKRLWSIWQALLSAFAWAFTGPSFHRFAEWVTAMAINGEEHTITQSVLALERPADWKALESFAEYGAWHPDYVTASLTRLVETGAIAPVPRISTKSGPFSPGEWLESLPGSARGY